MSEVKMLTVIQADRCPN